jgi:hypothetical protein
MGGAWDGETTTLGGSYSIGPRGLLKFSVPLPALGRGEPSFLGAASLDEAAY